MDRLHLYNAIRDTKILLQILKLTPFSNKVISLVPGTISLGSLVVSFPHSISV